MKNNNLKHLMLMLTLATGTTVQMQATHNASANSSCDKSDMSSSEMFNKEYHRLNNLLDKTNDARKTTKQPKLNMEFGKIRLQINELDEMPCDGTMRQHHVNHLNRKLEHIERKADHYYSEKKSSRNNMDEDNSFDDSELFSQEYDRIKDSIENANDARKTTQQSQLNMELDNIQMQINLLAKMTGDSTMREHHINHLNNKLAHVERKADHYYSELSQ